MFADEKRSAGHNHPARVLAPCNDLPGRLALHQHGADEQQSVQARSLSVNLVALRSIRRSPHFFGNMAAMVNSPRGGEKAFLRRNFKACLKL
jgi:hypothetical protein